MKLPQWCIDQLWDCLKETLESPSLPKPCDDDPHEWAWQVKDTEIQFVVYVEDTDFHVEVNQQPVLITNEPEKVVQEAKAFKSKYLSANQ